MKLRIEAADRGRWTAGERIFAATTTFLLAVYGLTRVYGLSILPPCHFRRLSGLPCPTCGFGRGLSSLAAFDVRAAFAYNPLVPLVAVFFAVGCLHLLGSIATGRRLVVVADLDAGRLSTSVGLAALLATWVYQILCNGSV